MSLDMTKEVTMCNFCSCIGLNDCVCKDGNCVKCKRCSCYCLRGEPTVVYNILVLFSGIGGMTKDWQDHNITYVEIDKEIYEVGRHLFPNQKWLCMDVIWYLENTDLSEFDVIFINPPCTTHSTMNRFNNIRKVPDYTTLFGVRAFIIYYYPDIPYVLENTSSMYSLKEFPPYIKIGRHLIWSNREIEPIEVEILDMIQITKNQILRRYGLSIMKLPYDTLTQRQIVRNILDPKIANYLLDRLLWKG